MAKKIKSLRLTEAHKPDMAEAIRLTKPGQASWAGRGPEGKKCYQCALYSILRVKGGIAPMTGAKGHCKKREQIVPKEKRITFDPQAKACTFYQDLIEARLAGEHEQDNSQGR